MPSGDYLPARDGDFDAWQQAFLTYATANQLALGLDAGDITALSDAQTEWDTAYADQQAQQAQARAATEAKKEAKQDYRTIIRSVVRQIQANPSVTNAQRENLGITVPDPEPTPVPPPGTAPTVAVDTSQRLQHTLRLRNIDGGRSKPEGVSNAEIWAKIGGEPPADPGELSFVGQSSRFSFLRNYPGAEANTTAHYMVRWVNGKGEAGPWSETVSASIAA